MCVSGGEKCDEVVVRVLEVGQNGDKNGRVEVVWMMMQ